MPSSTALRFPSAPTRPQPPPSPSPWLWRCHQCHILYRLATTRRCLECDHEFCLTTQSPPTGKKSKRGGPCRAEFDYVGWAARGAWRRTMSLNSKNKQRSFRHNSPALFKQRNISTKDAKSTGIETADDQDTDGGVLLNFRRWIPADSLTSSWGDEHRALEHGSEHLVTRFAEKKEALFVRRRHNCWLHCDFPSECHHVVFKAQQEGRPVLARARAIDETYLNIQRAKKNDGKEREVRGPSRLRPCRSQTSGLAQLGMRGAGMSKPISVMESDDDEDEDEESSDDSSDDEDGGVSPCSSPPPQEEVIEGKQPISPILPNDEVETRTSPNRSKNGFTMINFESDFSYETFKKTAAASPSICPENSTPPIPSTGNLEFEIHVDQDNYMSPPVSPIHSSATADPIPIPRNQPAKGSKGDDNDLDAFLASLYTHAARDRRYNAKTAHIAAIPTTQAVVDPLLHSFTPYESFPDVPQALHRHSNHAVLSSERTTGPLSSITEEERQSPLLEQAYSDQAWFPDPAHAEDENHTRHRKSRRVSRTENAERMLALLSRRTSVVGSSSSSPVQQTQQTQPPPPPAGVEDCDNSSDCSSSSSTSLSSSSSSSASTIGEDEEATPSYLLKSSSSSSSCHRTAMMDGDGDSIMIMLDDDGVD